MRTQPRSAPRDESLDRSLRIFARLAGGGGPRTRLAQLGVMRARLARGATRRRLVAWPALDRFSSRRKLARRACLPACLRRLLDVLVTSRRSRVLAEAARTALHAVSPPGHASAASECITDAQLRALLDRIAPILKQDGKGDGNSIHPTRCIPVRGGVEAHRLRDDMARRSTRDPAFSRDLTRCWLADCEDFPSRVHYEDSRGGSALASRTSSSARSCCCSGGRVSRRAGSPESAITVFSSDEFQYTSRPILSRLAC